MPYIENGIMFVHNSEITTFKRCRLKWKYAYRDNLVPIYKPRPLFLGSVGHAGLEFYYKNEDYVLAMKRYVEADINEVITSGKLNGYQINDYIEESHHRLDLCIQVINNYVEYDKKYPIYGETGSIFYIDGEPLVEKTYEVLIPDIDLEDHPVMLRFTVDMAYERDGKIWLVDHKTGKNFLDVRKLDLDTQLSLYLWGLEKIIDNPIVGMEYNLLRMKLPTIPKVTKKNRMSIAAIDTTWEVYKAELLKHGMDPEDYHEMKLKLQDRIFFDRKHRYRTANELNTAYNEMVSTVKEMLQDDVPIYRNATNDCSWDCPYKELCIMEFKGDYDVDEYKEMHFGVGVNRRESFDDILSKNSIVTDERGLPTYTEDSLK